MKKDFVLPLDEIEVLDGELLLVTGGYNDSVSSNDGCNCNCNCNCSCDNENKGCNCNCNCKCGTPPPEQVLGCGSV